VTSTGSIDLQAPLLVESHQDCAKEAEVKTTQTLTSKANGEALALLEGALSSSVCRREFDG